MFTRKKISKQELDKFFSLAEEKFTIYSPSKKENNYFMRKQTQPQDYEISEYRTVEPLKSFYLPGKEKLTQKQDKPALLFSLKACDLNSLKVLDYVYLNGEYQDPYYTWRRENYFIFSTDCTSFLDTCFCTSLGYTPYPQEGFDLNLIPLSEEAHCLEIGSEKAEKLLSELNIKLEDIGENENQIIQQKREDIYNKVKENADKILPQDIKDNLTSAVRNSYDSEIWIKEAERCVECGACTNICASCHCFFLITEKEGFDKLRVWDSCLYRTYALVAGGANPRKKLSERLRNRFLKKFDFFPEVINNFGCTGCGRCVSACLGNIDIRKVLSQLAGVGVK